MMLWWSSSISDAKMMGLRALWFAGLAGTTSQSSGSVVATVLLFVEQDELNNVHSHDWRLRLRASWPTRRSSSGKSPELQRRCTLSFYLLPIARAGWPPVPGSSGTAVCTHPIETLAYI